MRVCSSWLLTALCGFLLRTALYNSALSISHKATFGILKTIRQKLPEGFQRAEFLLEKGFVDAIVDRRDEKRCLAQLLALHTGEVNA